TPPTPYPTLVLMNDVMHIFVDFNPIVSSTSPDDGLALLLAMYAVFKLNFNKNNRTIRLLYAIVFGDKRFISNSIRDNDSIDINTDSYDNSSKVFEQSSSSSSSSSNVVATQKRKRAASTQKSKDKENCISFDDSNDDEHDQEDTICSSGSQLSSAVRRTRQKTRRY
ncbi:unnamed protein product, partial [Adineta steineri]